MTTGGEPKENEWVATVGLKFANAATTTKSWNMGDFGLVYTLGDVTSAADDIIDSFADITEANFTFKDVSFRYEHLGNPAGAGNPFEKAKLLLYKQDELNDLTGEPTGLTTYEIPAPARGLLTNIFLGDIGPQRDIVDVNDPLLQLHLGHLHDSSMVSDHEYIDNDQGVNGLDSGYAHGGDRKPRRRR